MNDVTTRNPNQTSDINNTIEINDNARGYLIVVYSLFLLGVTILPLLGALIGVLMAYFKRYEVRGTIYESHCTWIIRTFWYPMWGLAILFGLLFVGVLMLSATIFLLSSTMIFILWIIAFATGLWFLVRLIYGLICLLNGRGM